MTTENKSGQAKEAAATAAKPSQAVAAKDTAKTAVSEPAKEQSKAAKKVMTDSQKLKALVAAAKANGWSLPDEIHEED